MWTIQPIQFSFSVYLYAKALDDQLWYTEKSLIPTSTQTCIVESTFFYFLFFYFKITGE